MAQAGWGAYNFLTFSPQPQPWYRGGNNQCDDIFSGGPGCTHKACAIEVFTSYDGFGVIVWTIDFESKSEDAVTVAELVHGAISEGIEGMEQDLLAKPVN